MKKLFLIIVVATFTFTSCSSFLCGLRGGASYAKISGEDADSYKAKLGFHAAAVVEIPVSDNFAVQPELLYSSQGSDYEDTYESGSANLDYINVPVMAKYYVSDKLSIEAGPQVGFLLSAKWKGDEFGEEDAKDDFKGIDFGLNLGVGYKLDSGLNFGARYNLGLADINDVSGENSKIHNGVFQFSVGYFFDF